MVSITDISIDKKHIDDQNNKQLHCSNIIIQFVNYTLYPDNKSLDITLNRFSGSGWFITNGKAMKQLHGQKATSKCPVRLNTSTETGEKKLF